MSEPGRRTPQPYESARDRIAARRRARQGGGWRLLAAGLAAAGVLLVAGVGLALRRADQTLSAIQQEDPRRRTATGAGAPLATAALSAATLAPSAAAQATAPLPAADAPRPTLPAAALPDSMQQPFSVLLVGVDKRSAPEDGVRSDTLILVRVDPGRRTASMLSIPRDTVASIPNVGLAKINYAFSYGYTNAEALYGAGTNPDAAGGAVAAEAVESLLGVSVDYIAQVDFQGFERMVDSVGGVLVDVQAPLLDAEYPTENYGVERIYIPQGLQLMDGRTALIYARTRHASSDFDRGRRQQQVLRALLAQVRSRGLLENAAILPRWAEVLEQNIRTTLPLRDLALVNGMASLARDLGPDRILQLSINPNDVALDGENGTDLYWNPGDLAALMARWEAGPTPGAPAAPEAAAATPEPGQPAGALPTGVLPPPSPAPTSAAPAEDATVQVLNASTADGVAGRVSQYLGSRGFAMADPESLTRTYEHTTIIDYSGRPLTRAALAALLGVDARYVQATPAPDAPPPGFGVDIVVVVGADYRPEWAGQ